MLVRAMGLFLVWCHRLICIVLSLCKHARKEVCDVKQGVDPYPLLARSCDKWWPDFVTFTACKISIFWLKRGKKAQCVSNRCKYLFKWKKDFGVMGTLTDKTEPARLVKSFWSVHCCTLMAISWSQFHTLFPANRTLFKIIKYVILRII